MRRRQRPVPAAPTQGGRAACPGRENAAPPGVAAPRGPLALATAEQRLGAHRPALPGALGWRGGRAPPSVGGWQAASGVHGTGASLDTHSWLYVEEDLFGRPGSSGVSGFWLTFLPRCFEDFRKFCVNRAESVFPVGERSTQVRWASDTGRGQAERGHLAHRPRAGQGEAPPWLSVPIHSS